MPIIMVGGTIDIAQSITKTLFQVKISWYKKIPLADEAKLVSMTHTSLMFLSQIYC